MDQYVAPSPAFASSPSAVHVVFQNYRPQFRRLVFRGVLLELITLGFYRFWLATDIRRHLWRTTSVEGDTLEYTGTGWELFLGAIFALVILAPVYLAYFLIGLEAERYKAFASLPLILFYYLFSQFALFRARRYRMTRTIWRGVRFWMTGSGWDYAWRSSALMLLVILTCGLALPWREAVLERFKMRHSHYGDLQGRFEGTAWEFFKQGIWLWMLAVGLLLLPAVEAGLTKLPAPSTLYVMPWVFMIGAPFFYAAFKAIQWRWWISGIRFGEVSFSSTLRPSNLFGIYWKVIGWIMLIYVVLMIAFGVIGGVAYVMVVPPGAGPEAIEPNIMAMMERWTFLVPIGISYVVALLLIMAVFRIYLIHDLTWRLTALTTVHNIEAAQNVAGRGEAANALGEGFANSLDIFGF